MKIRLLANRLLCLVFVIVSIPFTLLAQQKTITGKVTNDTTGAPLAGVSVSAKGGRNATQTKADGTFSISVPTSVTTLTFTSVGYASRDVSITGTTVDVSLSESKGDNLNEVVVVGYGTVRKRDLTGSVASVQAKDFNKGVITNPDQLLQGKVAGLQVINSSGQPGAVTIVKIRGNNSIRSSNTPLYVIDGVPLDGRTARPGLLNNAGLGNTPDVNPLLFINPADIASIDVLKDASSAAIYGSRGANGVVLVTTKKGASGAGKVDVGAYAGIGNVLRRIKMLDASEYRSALKTYGLGADSGASVDPFGEITRTSISQNYTVAYSGGSENSRYRASLLAYDQKGLIIKSGLKKYVGNFNGQYKFLNNRLSFDYNITAGNVGEQVAPISTNAGSNGNLISQALTWNPTLRLRRANGLNTPSSGQINPLTYSDTYNDYVNITTLLGSFSLAYKILPELEYRVLYGANYSTGGRKQEFQGWISGTSSDIDGNGIANIGNTTLFSQTVTHTLNYTKKVSSNFSLNALAGYEYWKTTYQGNQTSVYGFDLNKDQASLLPDYHYYDNIQAGNQGNLRTASFKDPSVELQSFFARAVLNFKDRYLLTATMRSDGSSKFGKNNRYAYFPSAAIAWNVKEESFMQNQKLFNTLKLRVGYGATGNQEFNPVDAALPVAVYTANNAYTPVHFANPDLKWETVSSINGGVDFGIKNNRIYGSIDYFYKKTSDPILDFTLSQPTAGSGTIYKNLDGTQDTKKTWVTNNGVEIFLGANIIAQRKFNWNLTANATFLKNLIHSPELANLPFFKFTGELSGQGASGAYSQVIAHNQPIDVFYLPTFLGFDKDGIGTYSATPGYVGDPNPKVLIGFTNEFSYGKFNLTFAGHGNFGNKIYNNTAMTVTNISNIRGGRNISSFLIGNGENLSNFITPSSRYLESGNFVKLDNLTFSYRVGNTGKYIKGLNIYTTVNNLIVITNYRGFDPEINVDKTLNGIPSLGLDYIGYPSMRSFILGLNFSL